MERLTLAITGMSCGHCLNAVNKALADLAGVTVDNVRIGRAEVQFDPLVTNPTRIAAAIEDAGYVTTRI